jgi:hypothetical protein
MFIRNSASMRRMKKYINGLLDFKKVLNLDLNVYLFDADANI